MSVSRNPDRCHHVGMLKRRRSLLAGDAFHDLQQRTQIGSFFIECVSGNTRRYTVARKLTAYGDHVDRGKSAANHGEKFETRHTWHVEVRENDVRNFLPYLRQRGETVFSRSHTMSKLSKD